MSTVQPETRDGSWRSQIKVWKVPAPKSSHSEPQNSLKFSKGYEGHNWRRFCHWRIIILQVTILNLFCLLQLFWVWNLNCEHNFPHFFLKRRGHVLVKKQTPTVLNTFFCKHDVINVSNYFYFYFK